MVKVNVMRDKNGYIKGFTLEGHANAGDKGEDIVCAGVSAIVFTALGSLEQLAGIRNDVLDDGRIEFSLPENIEGKRLEKADVILRTMIIGLEMIKSNPSYEKYISIVDEEA